MEATFKLHPSEMTLEFFEAVKQAFAEANLVEISIKAQPKKSYKMSEEDFLAKISQANEDPISYHFKANEFTEFAEKLKRQEPVNWEAFKVVEE